MPRSGASSERVPVSRPAGVPSMEPVNRLPPTERLTSGKVNRPLALSTVAIAVPARLPPARLPSRLSAACHPASVGAPLSAILALWTGWSRSLPSATAMIASTFGRAAAPEACSREGRSAGGLVRQTAEIGERSIKRGLDGPAAEGRTAACGNAGAIDGEIADGDAAGGTAFDRGTEFRDAGEQPGEPRVAGSEIGRRAADGEGRFAAGERSVDGRVEGATKRPTGKRRQWCDVREGDGRAALDRTGGSRAAEGDGATGGGEPRLRLGDAGRRVEGTVRRQQQRRIPGRYQAPRRRLDDIGLDAQAEGQHAAGKRRILGSLDGKRQASARNADIVRPQASDMADQLKADDIARRRAFAGERQALHFGAGAEERQRDGTAAGSGDVDGQRQVGPVSAQRSAGGGMHAVRGDLASPQHDAGQLLALDARPIGIDGNADRSGQEAAIAGWHQPGEVAIAVEREALAVPRRGQREPAGEVCRAARGQRQLAAECVTARGDLGIERVGRPRLPPHQAEQDTVRRFLECNGRRQWRLAAGAPQRRGKRRRAAVDAFCIDLRREAAVGAGDQRARQGKHGRSAGKRLAEFQPRHPDIPGGKRQQRAAAAAFAAGKVRLAQDSDALRRDRIQRQAADDQCARRGCRHRARRSPRTAPRHRTARSCRRRARTAASR